MALLIIVFIVVVFHLGNYRYKKTNYYKNQFIDVQKFCGKDPIPQYLEVVNVGSSQPVFAFDYAESGMKGMNWAIRPQTFEFDLLILKQYHSCLQKNAFMLIPVCPFSFFAHSCFDKTKYYSINTPIGLFNLSFLDRIKRRYPAIAAGVNLKRIIRDIPPDNSLKIEYNPLTDAEMELDAQRWIDVWLRKFSLKSIDNIVVSVKHKNDIQANITILREMIDFCLMHNYRPIVIIMPVSEELTNLIPLPFVKKYILENIRQANSAGIPVFNYWGEKQFTNSVFFLNALLFNMKGRKKFTKTTLVKLQNLL
jgi:hypothetical protein